jgi:hypothetical protein
VFNAVRRGDLVLGQGPLISMCAQHLPVVSHGACIEQEKKCHTLELEHIFRESPSGGAI